MQKARRFMRGWWWYFFYFGLGVWNVTTLFNPKASRHDLIFNGVLAGVYFGGVAVGIFKRVEHQSDLAMQGAKDALERAKMRMEIEMKLRAQYAQRRPANAGVASPPPADDLEQYL